MRDTFYWAGTIARLGAKLLVALSLVVVMPTGARAQGIAYSFTKIADTLRNDAGLGGVQCVGMSDLGTVIVVFAPAGSSSYQLWRGDGQSFTQVETSLASRCASINDSDETAYLTPLSSGSSVVRLVKNTMGTLTTLARSDVAPFLSGPTTHLPFLSNSGSAVFMTAQGNGIAVGPAGPIVYDPSIGRPLTLISASMNDSLTVAFLALDAGRAGIYRGSAVPLIETGGVVEGGTVEISLVRPVINNSGTVAFVGSVGGAGAHAYTTTDGVSVTLVGTNPVDRLAINDSGAVAYRKKTSGGSAAGEGLYVGQPGSIDKRVIGVGDPLDGSTFLTGFVWEESLNNSGQLAFWAQLADGRWGVYRANPVPVLTSLSPSSATVGGAAYTLTVTGSHFVNGSQIRWNGAARATTFVSSGQLQAVIPASDIGAAGTASVTVVHPAPVGGTSNALPFTITPAMALDKTKLTLGAVTSGTAVPSSMQIRLVAGTETVNPFGYTQATAIRDGKLYLVQCSGTCDSVAGVIREFTYDLAANTITATGLVMTLADSGWALLHPTSLTFDPTNSNVAWVGNSLGSERAYYKIDWAKMKANTPGKFVRRVAEDRTTPGPAGSYVRPEFVQYQGTWYMAVAAYEYAGTPYVLRLYNKAAMDVAYTTSEAAVFTPGNSFTIPTQLTQNLNWDNARGILTLAQNQSPHAKNGRFVYLDLAASLASGTAVQIGNTYQNWSSPTRGGTVPTGTLETYRLLSSTKGIVAEDSKWYFVNLDVQVQEVEPGELTRSGWTGTASPLSASHPPARMLDGDVSTKYSSGRTLRPGDYFTVNMGAARTFDKIVMDSQSCGYARGYEVYVSSDGTSWGSPIATGTPTASPVTVTFPSQTKQHLKVVQTGSDAVCWWVIAELKVFASSAALSRSGWTGSASPLSTSYPPSKMLDGSLSTKYSSGRALRPGDSFTIDMQTPRTFSRIVMDSGSSTCDYARQYQVFVSDDGTTWGTPIATGTASASPVTAAFPTQTHRHFKVVQTGSEPNCWWTIAELNVFP